MARADVVFYFASAFIFGTWSASVRWPFVIAFLILGALSFIIAGRRRLPLTFTFIILFGFSFGVVYYHGYLNLREARMHIPDEERVSFTGIITAEPRRVKTYLRFPLELKAPYHGTIDVLTDATLDLQYGDVLSLTGRVERNGEPQPPISFFPRVSIIERGGGSYLTSRLIALKYTFIGAFDRFLPADSAALLAGLTFGTTRDFTEKMKRAMSDSGTTHLTALSGYNIVILIDGIRRSLGRVLARRTTFYLTILIIALFVIMVGAEASVVRAAIMGFLVLLAGETGRLHQFKNIVAVAAASMLITNPTLLVSSIGFQLSFLSLLGMTYLGPVLARFLNVEGRGEGLFAWRAHLGTTLAAQLAVIPVIIAAFDNFSLTAIVANVLILEFVPLTMFIGFLLAATSVVFPLAGFVCAAAAEVLLTYMHVVINLFAAIRLPISFDATNWIFAAAYYGILILLALRNFMPSSRAHASA